MDKRLDELTEQFQELEKRVDELARGVSRLKTLLGPTSPQPTYEYEWSDPPLFP